MAFPEELLRSANSMVIDEEVGENLRILVGEYITRTLEFAEYHVMLGGKTVHNDPGLDTARTGQNPWCNDKAGAIPELVKGTTSSPTQSTYAYKKQMPLWITARNKDTKQPITLNEASASENAQYVNEWSEDIQLGPDFPAFNNPDKKQMKTSITVPLRYGASSAADEGYIIGFISLHSEDYRACTHDAKSFFVRLARAIGAVLSAYENYQRQKDSTRAALRLLEQRATRETEPLRPPTIFCAYSGKADRRLIVGIRDALALFHPHIVANIWELDHSIGNISLHLQKQIAKCTYGICYLSEPSPNNEGTRFVDNPNVLFEAGMLAALVHDPAATPKGWIPIREQDSPSTPFDFAQERQLLVKRIAPSDELDEQALQDDLTNMIQALTGIPPKKTS